MVVVGAGVQGVVDVGKLPVGSYIHTMYVMVSCTYHFVQLKSAW